MYRVRDVIAKSTQIFFHRFLIKKISNQNQILCLGTSSFSSHLTIEQLATKCDQLNSVEKNQLKKIGQKHPRNAPTLLSTYIWEAKTLHTCTAMYSTAFIQREEKICKCQTHFFLFTEFLETTIIVMSVYYMSIPWIMFPWTLDQWVLKV